MIQAIFKTNKDTSGLVLRLILALVFFPHGAQKVLGWFGGYGFTGSLQYFQGQGIPTIFVLLLFAAEFLGPIALVLGLFTRVSALGIGVAMSVAALVHLPNGLFMNWFGNQQGEGYEFHLLAIAIAAALVIKGGGLASLDGVLAEQKRTA
ncbi:hypothetical protein CH373_16805 [Leptospira perolatii]|uniref:DoxX family protein n=1 Tax=Leptospira perolatii TaxID=2023191 RepID=A0A2M9ZIU6_9LEPT|nr:DoxX family protein [Leptospira perolatii]PJZ68478.1 hypothetical protein CH360_16195 [Leptospira perolatii]PJZ71894.1 hypothetical protein CH373_16805 [Leptospira perolatii]